jgi:hypothetical protein
MAIDNSLVCITAEAAADLSTKQYHFVAYNSSSQVASVASAGAEADAVLQDKPAAQGRACSIAISGVSKVVASAAITAGAAVTSNNAGRAQTATTGNRVLGKALESASAAGDVIKVLLKLAGAPNA